MIKIENISHRYADSDREALSGLSLDIEKGRFLAIIGPNGSGKSTFIRHLNGLFLPNAGKVTVDGMDTADEKNLRAIREKVAFVFQNPDNQIVASSVEEDIAFGPENLGLPPAEIDRRVEAALAACNLTALRNKPPYLLSGGEKQRLAIAGACAMDFDYLVLDEPTSMLDPLLRHQVIELICQLHKTRGCAIVFVTNIMEEALLADDVLVLRDGRFFTYGPPQEVFADRLILEEIGLGLPQISYLAALLGEAGYPSLRGAVSVDELVEKTLEVRPCK
ncbi:MAG: energy-coupling factor transporter ATPase [Thiomicrospira sp.]